MTKTKAVHVAASLLVLLSAAAHADTKKKKKKKKPPADDTEIQMDDAADTKKPAPADKPDEPAAPPAASKPDEPPPAVVAGDAAALPALGWTDTVIASPLVAPKSQVGVFGSVSAVTVTTTAAPVPPLTTGVKTTNTAFQPDVGVGYGATDEITIGGEYAVPVADANGSFPNPGTLTAYAGYLASRDAKLLAIVGADASVFFGDTTTLTLHGGLTIRYAATDKVVLYTGNPLPLGPFGRQLSVGVNNSAPIALDLPVGLGVQASPKLFGWVGTTLAHIKLANTANAFFGADVLPLEIGALYRATKDLDVGGVVSFGDLKSPGDAFTVGVVARFYRPAPPHK